MGRALRELAPRDEWVIASKYSPRPAAQVDPAVSGAAWIRTCIDNSLRRLEEDIAYLEEPYVPHAPVGVMAQKR